jgi:HK97 family phage major capsid protein
MDPIERLRAKIKAELDKRSELRDELDAVVSTAEERDAEGALDEDETKRVSEIRSEVKEIDERLDGFEAELAEMEDAEARNTRADERRAALEQSAPIASVKTRGEPLTYHERSGHSFFRDMFAARYGMSSVASERLARHEREMASLGLEAETRDVTTGAFGALVVPQYLLDEYAEVARAGRPFLNTVRNLPLPDEGMTLNIPRGTTGTAVAEQATENTAVQETNFDETTLAVGVKTFAGQQDVSRQAIERGSAVDAIIFADLAADYAAQVDADAIVTMAAVVGINAVTYTSVTPTVPELWPKLADAVQQINSGRFLPADFWLMHPRRWGWIMSDLDSSNRPFAVPIAQMPQNALAVQTANDYGNVVGSILGLPVVTDANISTAQGAGTEDTVYAYRSADLIYFEEAGAPRQVAFEETGANTLTVKLVLFGYSAFAAGRQPAAISEISGTGLIAPTF